jgi:hypothetical protein
MTRKHFVLIADTIASLPVDDETRAAIISGFVAMCATQNTAFDRDRFVAACTTTHP